MKRAIILSVVGLLLAVAAWLLIEMRPSATGPVYQGKTAREWLGEANTTNQMQVFAAFHQMGTNAVPLLVQELKRKDSPWDRFYQGIYPKLPLGIRKHLSRPLPELNRWAAAEMMIINVDAKAAMPDFVQLLKEGNGDQQLYALRAMVNFVGSKDARYVPVLIDSLQSTNVVLLPLTATALGRIGPGARAAVPALTNLLDSLPAEMLREQALWALRRIDPKAAMKYEAKFWP